MGWALAFLVGVVLGLVYPRGTTTAKNQVEINCPSCPELTCPVQPPADLTALRSLTTHQDLLIKCYEEVDKGRAQLESCRLDVVGAKVDAEEWHQRYNNLRAGD